MPPTLSARLLSLALLLSLFSVGQPGFGTAVAAAVAAICVVVFALRFTAATAVPRRAIVASRAAGTIYRRLADPDAAGHTRPRAPGFAR